MGLVSETYTFSAGAVIIAAQHNTNFDTLYNLVNGALDTDNLDASAGIVDTQLAHQPLEAAGGRHHVRQGTVGIGYGIDIEVARTGNSCRGEQGMRLAHIARQVERGITDHEIGLAKFSLEPVASNERVHGSSCNLLQRTRKLAATNAHTL